MTKMTANLIVPKLLTISVYDWNQINIDMWTTKVIRLEDGYSYIRSAYKIRKITLNYSHKILQEKKKWSLLNKGENSYPFKKKKNNKIQQSKCQFNCFWQDRRTMF